MGKRFNQVLEFAQVSSVQEMSPKPQCNASFGYIVYGYANAEFSTVKAASMQIFKVLLHVQALALGFVGWLTKEQ